MLVLSVTVEPADRRFENMGRRRAAGRHSPTNAVKQQGGLGLSACEAELTFVSRQA